MTRWSSLTGSPRSITPTPASTQPTGHLHLNSLQLPFNSISRKIWGMSFLAVSFILLIIYNIASSYQPNWGWIFDVWSWRGTGGGVVAVPEIGSSDPSHLWILRKTLIDIKLILQLHPMAIRVLDNFNKNCTQSWILQSQINWKVK